MISCRIIFTANDHLGAMLLYMQKETQYHNVALPYRKQGLVGRLTYGYAANDHFTIIVITCVQAYRQTFGDKIQFLVYINFGSVPC